METSRSIAAEYSKPEHELLARCSRIRLEAIDCERLRLVLQQPLDWPAVIYQARRHRVTPLLYWHLHHEFSQQVPKSALDDLTRYFSENTRRNLSVSSKLMQILNLFERNEVPAIPFKGPVLGLLAYGNVSLREFLDLDILVHPEHVGKATDLLNSLGYVFAEDRGDREENDTTRDLYNHYFVDPSGECAIELHWRLAKPHFSSLAEVFNFWDVTTPMTFFNTTVRVPRRENLLLYLCAHGSRHRWLRLSWIVDVAELIKATPDLDWFDLMEYAARLRSRRVLLMGLALAHDILELPLPEMILDAIRKDRQALHSLTRQLQADIFANEQPQPNDLLVYSFHLRMRENWLDKLTYLRYPLRKKMKPNMRDEALIKLPDWLSPLYYVLRPFRLATDYGSRWISRFRNQIQRFSKARS